MLGLRLPICQMGVLVMRVRERKGRPSHTGLRCYDCPGALVCGEGQEEAQAVLSRSLERRLPSPLCYN